MIITMRIKNNLAIVKPLLSESTVYMSVKNVEKYMQDVNENAKKRNIKIQWQITNE